MKPLLRYVLPDMKEGRSKSLESLKESENSGAENDKDKSSARSNH